MYITLYFIVTRLPDSLRSVRDHFLSLYPTSLTIYLLKQHLLAAETSAVAVGAARGTLRPPFFEGCSPSPLAPSYASAAAADVSVPEDVGSTSASAKHHSKGKGGRGGGGGSGGGGGGSGSGGGGSSGGGGGGGTVGGSGGSGGSGGGSGGSGGSGGGGTGSGGTGARRLSEWFLRGASGGSCPYVIRTGDRAGQTCGRLHTQHRCFSRLDDAWCADFGDDVELPRWVDLLKSRIAIFDLDFDAFISAMCDLSASAEGDCYRCVPPDPSIAAAVLGASESGTLPSTAPAEALYTFMLDSGASRCFFRDSTALTPLPAPVWVRLADPSGGPVVAHSFTVLSCPAVPSGSLSGLHLPSFSTNLVSTAALQDAMVTTTTPGGHRVSICTCTRTGRHLATFTLRPRSSLYTLAIDSSLVAAFAQVSVSGQVAASCSCRLLSHQTLLWHHRLGHPSLPRLRGMHSRLLSRERYFLLVVDDYTRYTTVFPLRSKGQVVDVLISWIRTVPLQLRERLGQDLPVLRLHSDRGGEFSSDLLQDFFRGEGILLSFTLPESLQQNGIAERRIGLVMEVARTSMIHAAAPHFLWPFAVRYVAHQLNLWPRVSLPETSPTLHWAGEVGDVSVFRVWGSRAFVRDTSADKLSPRAIPCVFLGFVPDAPGWQFYHPTSRHVFPSQDVTFDESVPFYRLFPYRSAPPPPPPLFLAPAPLGVSQVDPLPGPAPVQTGGAELGGVETGGAKPGGVASGSGEPGGAEPEGVEPGGAVSEGAESGGVEPQGAASSGGSAGAGCTGVAARADVCRSTATTGLGGVRTRGTGAARTGGVEGAGVGDLTESVGGPGVGGAVGGGARAVDPGGTVRPRPYFVPLLQQVLGTPPSAALTPPLLCPPPDQTQPPLQPASPLPAPSPYSEQSGGLTERRERASCPGSPVRPACRVPHSRPPPVPGTHSMTLRPSFVPLRVPLPPPPESSLPEVPDPESDRARAASPTVSRLLATAVIDPSFESAAALALIAELLEFAAACRLDYATALVAESASASPPSVGGECALGTDVLEDRQEEFECLAAAIPRFASMPLAPEGDSDAPDISTPRSYAEAITGPYSSQWQAAMDAEMASWKSTGTYADEVPPPGANIVDGMWIFRVKWPPGSPPAFKARYVARGFTQQQGVDYFHTFSPTPKMTTLRVLLHVAAQRDYELHSLDFSTAFLQGSLHEEIWLCRPPGFTESFPAGTQWSLQRPVYGLRQAPREWHVTLRTTLAALRFAPATADPSLFLRTDTLLPPFFILVYVDDLVFATADTEALTLVNSELLKRHTCTDLGELRSYLGLQITWDRARRSITLTQSHMVHQVLQRFGFQISSAQPTPLSTSHSLSAPPSDESVEPSGPYPELVRCLMYLMTCTRPELSYLLSLLACYVAPRRHRKRLSHGYTFNLGFGSVSWRSTRSSLVLSSSCEAEIYAGAMAAQELRWLTYLLTDLGEQPRSPLVMYWRGQLCLAYVATRASTADIFTKALPPGDLQRFSTVLGLVIVDSGGAGGGAARGVASGGDEPAGAEPGGSEPASAEPGGAEREGAEPWGAESEGVEPGGAESEGAESGGAETRAGCAGASSPGGAGVSDGAGGTGVAGGAGPGGARTRGTGAAGAGGVGGAGAGDLGAGGAGVRGVGAGGTRAGDPGAGGTGGGDPGAGGAGAKGTGAEGVGTGGTGAGGTGAGGAGAGGAGAGGAGAGGAGAGGSGAGGAGAGGTVQRHPFFVPQLLSSLPPPGSVLRQVLSLSSSTGLTPSLLCPPPHQTQPQLQPESPLPAPSPYAEQTDSLTERREPSSRPPSPVCAVHTGHRVPRPCPPPVPGTHIKALCPSNVPLRVPLPSPPAFSLADGPDPESDLVRAANPTVTRLLATVVTNPSFESASASALVADLVDFAATCRLDYVASLVAKSESDCPPSIGSECALGTDVLKDLQEDFNCLASAVPHLVAMLLAPEGDPDASDIPTLRSYAEAITGANIVDGMWIFRVKRPPGPPIFKARYVAQGFRQRQRVDIFQTFSPTQKMTTLWVLLHVAAQRDYGPHSLDFSTTFLRGSLHDEIWLRRPHGFTGWFPAGAQWSLPRPVLQRFGFQFSSPQPTPLPTSHLLSAPPSNKSVEPSGPYPELVSCLMYLMTCTRPDLAYPLSNLARYVASGRHRPEH
ncbi:unnamed protein product [Closterium sp. NIES-53]